MLIGIFGGTTEARRLIDYLGNEDVNVHYYVATNEGKNVIKEYKNIVIKVGRLDIDEMNIAMRNNQYDLIIDATHPYAAIVTKNIKEVCHKNNIKYLRVKRDIDLNKALYNDYDEVINYLNNHEGNILSTTGSKELARYININNYVDRLYVRLLPTVEAINECNKLGIKTSHIIAVQGPFSKEYNKAILKDYNIKYMISKLGGQSGGFNEKEQACLDEDVELLTIGIKEVDEGNTLFDTYKVLNELINIHKNVNIIGMGMGNINNITLEAKERLAEASLIIGSNRLINNLKDTMSDKEFINEYNSDKIKFILKNTYHKNICIIFSGDIGFYSGAKCLMDLSKEYNIHLIPGISSYSYLACKIGISYEDVVTTSLHGRYNNIIHYVSMNKIVFSLVGGDIDTNGLLHLLKEYKLDNCKLYIGENLSLDDEKISSGYVDELIDKAYSNLTAVFIINDEYKKEYPLAINDDEFIKTVSPMTKEDIRLLSISKLKLTKDSIVYDIGAGTGSVSIEASQLVYNGKVYAVEKNKEAIPTIISNKIKFKCFNMEVIEGTAPEVLKDLEIPTHAFIGGSSGNLEDIINVLFNKNEHIRIVINTVTMETTNEVFEIVKKNKLKMDVELVNISKAQIMGSYHMMKANNPVYIFTIEK